MLLMEDDNAKHQVHTDHKLTKRELRFLQFASIEYDDVIYMSPMDFIDSLTLDHPRERVYRRVLKGNDLQGMLKKTPPFRKGNKDLFRKLDQGGIISYAEYIFLLTLLTKSRSSFKIAFMMFDEDDSGFVDRDEFLLIRSLTSSLRSTRSHSLSRDDSCQLDPSDFNFVVNRLSTKLFAGTDAYTIVFQKTDTEVKKQDTTLLLHLFGLSGRDMLSFDQFQTFCANLQEELMEIEFHEFSRGKEAISPLDFARLILRYTIVHENDYSKYINRVQHRLTHEDKGITMEHWRKFSYFLNNLEDFATAVRLYTNANMPVTAKEFERAVRSTTGLQLDEEVIDMLYKIFDANIDGFLTYGEFLSVMNDRLHRGLRGRVDKHWGWKQMKSCVAAEVGRK
ncbi:unnamed protein product, partial [Mesorhabditis belari]|uniref:EF-hand domain-containing protein n=1 Tax=Mesorhabditis belari TaxID=2138241 RepID=A0AAF3FNI4_9BILA